MDIEKRIGTNLAHYRKAAGLSQADLAKKLSDAGEKFTQQMIARVESGDRPLRLSEYEALRVALEFPGFGTKLAEHEAWATRDAKYLYAVRGVVKHRDALLDAAKDLARWLVQCALLLEEAEPEEWETQSVYALASWMTEDFVSGVQLALLKEFDTELRSYEDAWADLDNIPEDAHTPHDLLKEIMAEKGVIKANEKETSASDRPTT